MKLGKSYQRFGKSPTAYFFDAVDQNTFSNKLFLFQKAIQTGRISKVEQRVTFMISLMIIAFLTAWTPYAILALVIQFGSSSIVTPSVAVIPALFAKSSICYNPVIYAGLNSQVSGFL